jgi:hypothetical protein
MFCSVKAKYRVILPGTRPNLAKYLDLPMFFLLGSGEWKRRMVELIVEKVDCLIVNLGDYPEARHHRVGGVGNSFPDQRAWEEYFQWRAARLWPTGCVIGWRDSDNEDETREIATWRTHKVNDSKVRFVVGIDPNFPRLVEGTRNNFRIALGNSFKICNTMEKLAIQAVRYA